MFIRSMMVMLLLTNIQALAAGEAKKTETKKAETKKAATKKVVLPKVEFKTTEGVFVVELNADVAPVTAKNFLSYVEKKHYDGTVFHRVINGFMIQGGGFSVKGDSLEEKSTGKPIKNEGNNGLSNKVGTIAMARTSDPNSATAQFFINVKDNSFLDAKPSRPGYAVFGKVVKGMDVVNKIKSVKTGSKMVNARGPNGLVKQPFGDVPEKNVIIEKIKVL